MTVCTIAQSWFVWERGAESDRLSWEPCVPWLTATGNATERTNKQTNKQTILNDSSWRTDWRELNEGHESWNPSLISPLLHVVILPSPRLWSAILSCIIYRWLLKFDEIKSTPAISSRVQSRSVIIINISWYLLAFCPDVAT